AAGRQQLDVGHGDARAGDGVAAREAHRRAAAAARVVRAADPPVRDAVDAHGGGLVGAAGAGAAVRIAVVLVDDDAAPDVHHLDGVEHHPRHRPGAALPRLDPHAVVGVDDARAAHGHVRHARPRAARAQAADADAVAVHARDVLDAHPRAAAADADAVVAVADPGVEDPDGARVLDVDAVGVRARRRRADDEAVDQHPAAPVELEVELRAVLHPQALHAHVAARHELDQLHTCRVTRLRLVNYVPCEVYTGDSTTPRRCLRWCPCRTASSRRPCRRRSTAAGRPPPASSPARPAASARRRSAATREAWLAWPGEDGGGDGEHAVGRHEHGGGLRRARRLPRRAERARVAVGARAVARRAERPHVEHVADAAAAAGAGWRW
ncbi:Os01g0329350, partial [Oryza sativa Japonica Group]